MYRPIYHFMPEKNWMNDPNGLIYHHGEYHMFYQYNPGGSDWGDMHWGHAKSLDLVHWKHLPIALAPSVEIGEEHCYSGCCVMNGEAPTILYTSIGPGHDAEHNAEQWMAVGSPDLLTWRKFEGNPVMTLALHEGMGIKDWRDPYVWKEGDSWYMVLGARIEWKGIVLIYRSQDLVRWEFLNILYKSDTDKICECPNFFELNGRHVLQFAPYDTEVYYVGNYNKDHTFSPILKGVVDNGGFENYYASNNLVDGQGRRIMWGWINEGARGEFDRIEGWKGIMSLPRILTVDSSDRLVMKPAPELQALRRNGRRFEEVAAESGTWLPGIHGRALEIIIEADPAELPDSFGILLLRTENGEEETRVDFNVKEKIFTVNRSRSSLSDQVKKWDIRGKLTLDPGEVLKVHIFVDHSVIEVFVNDRDCTTARVYPTREDSTGIGLYAADDGSLKVKSMEVWEMDSIWD